ncbi:hypothetical protein DV735_g2422, partial [Chaetothyriales sp. CBS 134920]
MADPMDIDQDAPRGMKRTADEAGLPPEAPRRIKADVINKIAAGEIIVAPMNALKELMENSVDAGSTSVEVLVKEGGLKLLQITDNGHGIERDDLPILCERFTTSKLKQFEDLQAIGTYGFRGEALASISHIAHLRVTTRTARSSCAWQAHYLDGKLTAPKPGQPSDPKPCAGRPGTQITVEDLFYNIPNRRRAFRSASEEYAKILDVVTRYAVHCSDVAFSVKKHGDSATAFSVPAAASKLDRIKQAYGAGIAKDAVEISTHDTKLGFTASGYATNANYSAKRTVLLLFINNRAVESSAMKKAIEQTYQVFLPKGAHPFVYLSLDIEPNRVDVNVHPTKREVHFLNEDEIIELVSAEIRERLARIDTARTFKTQTILPGILPITPPPPPKAKHPSIGRGTTSEKHPPPGKTSTVKKPSVNSLIRTDSKARKITPRYTTTDREQVEVRLKSVKALRAQVRSAMHDGLTEAFASLTYVGLVDSHRRLAAIQSGIKLYLCDYGLAANEFFYQLGLTDFGNFGLIQLNPPLPIPELLSLAADFVELDDQNGSSGGGSSSSSTNKSEIIAKVHAQLVSRKAMLKEYFSLHISDDDQHLEAIPLLLRGYTPCMAKLPTFLLRLGPYVDWTDETECFRTFLLELAAFYVPERLQRETEKLEHILENILFPAFRARIVATKAMLSGMVEVANLKGLYRVFERC